LYFHINISTYDKLLFGQKMQEGNLLRNPMVFLLLIIKFRQHEKIN
jgi:hypothetical protein